MRAPGPHVTLARMHRPWSIAIVLAFLGCAVIASPHAAAQEDDATGDTEERARERPTPSPASSDLDLEMAGYPLLVASAVMWVQYVFARIEIDGFNGDPRVDAYRRYVGDSDPDATDICVHAEASVGNVEAAYVRGVCRRGADAEARGWAFLTLGLLTAATAIVFIAVDLAIEPAPMTLGVGPGRIELSGTF